MRPLIILLLATGCKAPPDAPQELDELVGYMFANVANEDTAPLEAGSENLALWLDARLEDTLEGFTVNELTADGIESLEDGERSIEGVAGAAVGHESPFTVEELGITQIFSNPTDVYPDTYEDYERDYHTDEDCFRSGECDWLEFDTHATQKFALGLTVQTNSRVQFRWVESELGAGLVQRSWLHTPADVSLDFLKLHEQFYMWAFIPTENGSRSVQATWVVAELAGAPVPEAAALQMVVDSMRTTAETLDIFIEAHGPLER